METFEDLSQKVGESSLSNQQSARKHFEMFLAYIEESEMRANLKDIGNMKEMKDDEYEDDALLDDLAAASDDDLEDDDTAYGLTLSKGNTIDGDKIINPTCPKYSKTSCNKKISFDDSTSVINGDESTEQSSFLVTRALGNPTQRSGNNEINDQPANTNQTKPLSIKHYKLKMKDFKSLHLTSELVGKFPEYLRKVANISIGTTTNYLSSLKTILMRENPLGEAIFLSQGGKWYERLLSVTKRVYQAAGERLRKRKPSASLEDLKMMCRHFIETNSDHSLSKRLLVVWLYQTLGRVSETTALTDLDICFDFQSPHKPMQVSYYLFLGYFIFILTLSIFLD